MLESVQSAQPSRIMFGVQIKCLTNNTLKISTLLDEKHCKQDEAGRLGRLAINYNLFFVGAARQFPVKAGFLFSAKASSASSLSAVGTTFA